jgi:methyl-accepting chemotaxis protein
MAKFAEHAVSSVKEISDVSRQHLNAAEEAQVASAEVSLEIRGIAAVVEENSTATEEVTGATALITDQVEAVVMQADALAHTSARLLTLAGQFRTTGEERVEKLPERPVAIEEAPRVALRVA